jgi:hypothetical protein
MFEKMNIFTKILQMSCHYNTFTNMVSFSQVADNFCIFVKKLVKTTFDNLCENVEKMLTQNFAKIQIQTFSFQP